ncbi:MAG: hypothetical protein GVY30_00155 [Chloroflexi bacterium]|jgi:hypothetical protein|nr:hypothetical protein [Chloroflexota bacterium]
MNAVPNMAIYAETLPAGEDLSEAQYRFVKRDDDTYVAITANTDQPDGVLQNEPDVGEPCHVIAFGGSKLAASEALVVGNMVGPSANGRAEVRTQDQTNTLYIAARIRSAVSNANEIAAALVNCITPTMGV